METSINVGNNRLAASGGINRQTIPLDCSAGKDSNSCSFLHASSFCSSVNSRPEMALHDKTLKKQVRKHIHNGVKNTIYQPPLKRFGKIAAAKITGKRKAPAQPTSKKAMRNSPLGFSVKKRRISKVQNSLCSRRRLVMNSDANKTGAAGPKKSPPAPKIVPASRRKVVDFRPPQDPLPLHAWAGTVKGLGAPLQSSGWSRFTSAYLQIFYF